MDTIVVLTIVIAIVGVASTYIYREKKKGVKCIGCSSGCSCSSGGCQGECHCDEQLK